MKMSEVSDTEGHSVMVSIDNHDDVSPHLGPETVQIINLQPDTSPTVMEPPLKRIRNDDIETTPTPGPGAEGQTIKQILFNINKAICLRLDAIENKLETVSVRTKYLESRMEQISQQIKDTPSSNVIVQQNRLGVASRRSGAVIVGLPQEKEEVGGDSMNSSLGSEGNSADGVQNLGPNVTLITLNSEEDFPHGCWLGDENNPEMRVRAPIMPSDLLHIHSNCRTPEKMALTLLDYLFDRETQALSNLSGMGKHGKRQLDPLMIYGIRCHLIHKFGITEQDWHRIKQNIDSKCRTAFRRRLKGMPLQVKAFRGKAPPTYAYVAQNNDNENIMHEISAEELQQVEDGQLHISEGEVDMTHPILTASTATEIIQNSGTEIQVLHATPEQVAQLQQTHQIQILQGDQVLQEMSSGDAHPTSLPSGIRVVSTSGGLSHGPFRVVASPGSLSEGIRVVNASTGQLVATGPSADTINIQPQVEADDDEEEEPIVNETDVVQDSDQ